MLDETPAAEFAANYVRHRGNFDDHIATSIPGFREMQTLKGAALEQVYGRTGADVLDIGASEAALVKTLSERSDGRIRTVAHGPNPEMAREQAEISQVPRFEYRNEAFVGREASESPSRKLLPLA